MDERADWIGFNLVNGIGAVRFQPLLDPFGDAEEARRGCSDPLIQAGRSERILERLEDLKSIGDPEKYWDTIQKQGIRVLLGKDAEYPPHMKEIDGPPPVLFVRGAIPLLKAEAVLEAPDLTRTIERQEVRRAVPSGAAEAARRDLLDLEPLPVEDLRAQSGLPIGKMTSALTMMELKGMVRQAGKMKEVAVRVDHANDEVEKG